MFKKGFTLAEVLITLMIIGVVATLTTPALVKNVGSSKIGPQLSKFVNTWETATEQLMMDENISRLSDIGGITFGSDSLTVLSKYMIMTSLKNTTPGGKTALVIKSSDGATTVKSYNFSTSNIWQLKDGTIYVFTYSSDLANGWYGSSDATGAYKGPVGAAIIDIGGINGAHRIGKEVFGFFVDNSGLLVPYGSNAYKSMSKKDSTVNCNQTGTTTQQGACTGAVADNGWKAPW